MRHSGHSNRKEGIAAARNLDVGRHTNVAIVCESERRRIARDCSGGRYVWPRRTRRGHPKIIASPVATRKASGSQIIRIHNAPRETARIFTPPGGEERMSPCSNPDLCPAIAHRAPSVSSSLVTRSIDTVCGRRYNGMRKNLLGERQEGAMRCCFGRDRPLQPRLKSAKPCTAALREMG